MVLDRVHLHGLVLAVEILYFRQLLLPVAVVGADLSAAALLLLVAALAAALDMEVIPAVLVTRLP